MYFITKITNSYNSNFSYYSYFRYFSEFSSENNINTIFTIYINFNNINLVIDYFVYDNDILYKGAIIITTFIYYIILAIYTINLKIAKSSLDYYQVTIISIKDNFKSRLY